MPLLWQDSGEYRGWQVPFLNFEITKRLGNVWNEVVENRWDLLDLSRKYLT